MAILKSANEFYFKKRTTVTARKISSTLLLGCSLLQTAMVGSPFTIRQIMYINFGITLFMVVGHMVANLFKEDDTAPYPQTDNSNPSPNSVPDGEIKP